MIAAMASLANNRELLNKVVPRDQNFKIYSISEKSSLRDHEEMSEFSFQLYKNGKPHVLVVNEKLTFWNWTIPFFWNTLYYSCSCNQNFVGPLLEKALIELLFKGNYELAKSVNAVNIFTCFSNSLFEEIHYSDLGNFGFKLKDVITHGIKTNSLMVVDFKDNASNVNILDLHYYSLIDYKEDMLKLYDPHGTYIMIPTNTFIENFDRLTISYIDSKIFRIPKLNTFVEFADTWNGSKNMKEFRMFFTI